MLTRQRENVFVYLGETLPTSFEDGGILNVKDWATNPKYRIVYDENKEFVTGLNDVALIVLDQDAPTQATPVPVLDDGVTLQNGQSSLLAGFGLLNEFSRTSADGLYYVRVPLAKIAYDSIFGNRPKQRKRGLRW